MIGFGSKDVGVVWREILGSWIIIEWGDVVIWGVFGGLGEMSLEKGFIIFDV